MVPQPFFQRQSGGRSAKGLTSQERPPSPTKGRRRSVFSPEPQVPTTVEFELLADEYGLGSVKKSTKAVHLVLPRWSAFSLGVSIGLIIATGIFWMNHWIMFGRKDHHPTSGDLPMLGKKAWDIEFLILKLILTNLQLHQAITPGTSPPTRASS